ncbi:uncharacterized protein LOC125837971 [Solanum verrucosum]|uniref:uncharacterized protein LOC125837971 n=1 Tax=Solanum verrucosum TaxID=315347 RepID=UPI0020D1CBEE|nr:uncharacterized protein LOC125837971 [Solanum verrucosum]
MDPVLIANEAVNSRTKQNKPDILCKLDIEKTYDHVNWKYLMKILESMGFGQKWMNWIMFCISTINFYVLINGLPAGFFSSQRGLRQGFDVLRDGAESLEVTHLQYADDTLIFCGAEEEQLKYVRVILVLFEGVSGLHINRWKSFMYPINEVNNMSYIASILGGVVATLPTTYLGMPLGAKSKFIEIWNGVIEKCEKKLARWKTQYLSMGGRLTLINSVLNALPIYMMSLFPIPTRVIKKLDRIRRNFLWQGNNEKKRFHLVKWESVVTGKKNDGLGIKNLIFQSEALRMKWLWRYLFEDQLMWKRVVGAKYEAEDSWMTKDVSSLYEAEEDALWWKGSIKGIFKVGAAYRVFLSLKDISWAMPRRITEALKSWEEAGVLAKNRTRWRIIPASIWWATWKERNSRCFESVENTSMSTVTCLRQRLLTCSSGVVPTKKLRLDETSSDLDRISLLGGYAIHVVQHYSTLTAGQKTPSLEWTAIFGHDSEDCPFGRILPVVEHYSTLAAGQGISSLEWTATFRHDSEGTRYETDTDLVHGIDAVGWTEPVEGLLLDNNLDDAH